LIRDAEGAQVHQSVLRTLQAKTDADIAQLPYPYAADIVANTLCADLVDYLRRDCFFTGLREDFRDRFLDYLFIPHAGRPAQGRLVIRLNKKDNDAEVRVDQMTDIVSLLRLRYRLAERVYYHHTKMKFGAMIGRAVMESDLYPDRDKLYKFTDDTLLEYLRSSTHEASAQPSWARIASRRLANALWERRLYVPAFLFRVHGKDDDRGDAIRAQLERTFNRTEEAGAGSAPHAPGPPKPTEAAIAYTDWVTELEKRVGVEPGDIAFFCPSRKMQRKIWEARVAYGDDSNIKPLREVQQGAHDSLIEDHARLWRFVIYVHPDYASIDPDIASDTQLAIAAAFEQRWARDFPTLSPIPNELKLVATRERAVDRPDERRLLFATYRRRRGRTEPDITDLEQDRIWQSWSTRRGGATETLPTYDEYERAVADLKKQ